MTHKRIKSRDPRGRFRRATLSNTFGIDPGICPHCGRFNPSKVNEPKPETCQGCGKALKEQGG